MTTTTECSELLPLVATLVLDADSLEPDERERVARHLENCKLCPDLVQTFEGARGELSVTPEPGVTLWSRIESRLDAIDATEPRVAVAIACTYCHDQLARDAAVFCAACLAPCHEDCWLEHGRCSALGCGETRFVQPIVKVARRPALAKKSSPAKRALLVLAFSSIVTVAALAPSAVSWSWNQAQKSGALATASPAPVESPQPRAVATEASPPAMGTHAGNEFEGIPGEVSAVRDGRPSAPKAPRVDLRSGQVVLQIRAGANGGNLCRVSMAGEVSQHVQQLVEDPFDWKMPVDMYTPTAAYCQGGLIHPGQVFVVEAIEYWGRATGDSNGHGELKISIGKNKVVQVKNSPAVEGVWHGREVVETGKEATVYLEVANSSEGEARFLGRLLPRELADADVEKREWLLATNATDVERVLRPLASSNRGFYDPVEVNAVAIKLARLGPGALELLSHSDKKQWTLGKRLAIEEAQKIVDSLHGDVSLTPEEHAAHAIAARRRLGVFEGGEVLLQARAGALGGNPLSIDVRGKTSGYEDERGHPVEQPLDLATPPTINDRAHVFVKGGGNVLAGRIFLLTSVEYEGYAAGDSNGDGYFTLVVGNEELASIKRRDEREGPPLRVKDTWRGRRILTSAQLERTSIAISNSSQGYAKLRGMVVPERFADPSSVKPLEGAEAERAREALTDLTKAKTPEATFLAMEKFVELGPAVRDYLRGLPESSLSVEEKVTRAAVLARFGEEP